MGSPSPVSFARGKRGLAGSLIFTVFDRGALKDMMILSEYAAKTSDIRSGGRAMVAENEFGLKLDTPNYLDQIPPFNITLTAGNEIRSFCE